MVSWWLSVCCRIVGSMFKFSDAIRIPGVMFSSPPLQCSEISGSPPLQHQPYREDISISSTCTCAATKVTCGPPMYHMNRSRRKRLHCWYTCHFHRDTVYYYPLSLGTGFLPPQIWALSSSTSVLRMPRLLWSLSGSILLYIICISTSIMYSSRGVIW